jgi:hypothetical protein
MVADETGTNPPEAKSPVDDTVIGIRAGGLVGHARRRAMMVRSALAVEDADLNGAVNN